MCSLCDATGCLLLTTAPHSLLSLALLSSPLIKGNSFQGITTFGKSSHSIHPLSPPLFGLTLPVSDPVLQHLYTPHAGSRADTCTQPLHESSCIHQRTDPTTRMIQKPATNVQSQETLIDRHEITLSYLVDPRYTFSTRSREKGFQEV